MSSQEVWDDLPPLSDYPDPTKVNEMWLEIIAQFNTLYGITDNDLLAQFRDHFNPNNDMLISKMTLQQIPNHMEELLKHLNGCRNDDNGNLLNDIIQNIHIFWGLLITYKGLVRGIIKQ